MLFFEDKVKINNLNNDSIILDIETTGVSRTNSSVIVVGIIDHKGNFLQFAIDDINEEKELLSAIYSHLNNKNIITFNGNNFDIPFLKARYSFFNIDDFQYNSQFDIFRYFINNKLLTDIEKFSLKEIEKYADIERYENFEFKDDKEFYKDLHNIDLSKILIHNKYDVINTEKLLNVVNKIEESKEICIDNKKINILNIEIDKNFLKINLIGPKLKTDHQYISKKYTLKWYNSNIELKVKIENGYIDDEKLGFVYISDKPIPKNNEKYQLPEDILVIFDNRYFLENIKNIIKYIIRKHIL